MKAHVRAFIPVGHRGEFEILHLLLGLGSTSWRTLCGCYRTCDVTQCTEKYTKESKLRVVIQSICREKKSYRERQCQS
jgi:hypothetical protein